MNAAAMAFVVTINCDQDGEYRVPSPDGREGPAYYTHDQDDAIDTALHESMYGPFVGIEISYYTQHPRAYDDVED